MANAIFLCSLMTNLYFKQLANDTSPLHPPLYLLTGLTQILILTWMRSRGTPSHPSPMAISLFPRSKHPVFSIYFDFKTRIYGYGLWILNKLQQNNVHTYWPQYWPTGSVSWSTWSVRWSPWSMSWWVILWILNGSPTLLIRPAAIFDLNLNFPFLEGK